MLLLSGITTLAAEPAEQDPAKLEAQLQALEAEINKFKTLLKETETEKSSLENNLEANEKRINEVLKRIRQLESEINKGQDKLSSLQQRDSALQGARALQQAHISRQMVAAYKMGEQEYLKVLLNQEDPNEISRMLTLYDYLNEARAKQITEYNQTLTELAEVSRDIESTLDVLSADQLQLRDQQQDLIAARREKTLTLAALNRELAETGDTIDRLLRDREQLESLLVQLERSLAHLPSPSDAMPFASLKGQMLLPVSGAISHRFGSRRSSGKMRWNGMVIQAEEGTPVTAIHYGRVVFSDWLRGFGLLMIISHGEGYMSLYGHNQVLYRETGDWVSTGETIARVGDSGGQQQTGLYFEIRVAGKPTDPQLWCKAAPSGAA